MWRRRRWIFCLGSPRIGLYSHEFKRFPGEKGYLEMLEEYKKDLEGELTAVKHEIREMQERLKQRCADQTPS